MRRIENCGALIERFAAVKPLDPEAPSPLGVLAGGTTCEAAGVSSSGSRLIGGGEETSVATPPTWRSNSET